MTEPSRHARLWSCAPTDHKAAIPNIDRIEGSELLEPVTHFVVVREDLARGQLCAQVTHAAGHSSPGNLPQDTHVVVLAAKNESHLLSLEQMLQSRHVPHHSVREPDLGNMLTAIGLVPTRDRRAARRVLGRLPLLK